MSSYPPTGSRATRCPMPILDLDPEGRGQLFDGCGFLLAHLGPAEAEKATLLGGFRNLLRHRDQSLVEPLGLCLKNLD